MYGFSRKGTEPVASPIGTPCRKYNKTSRPKFLLSDMGSSKKPWLFMVGVFGTWSSKVKDSRAIRLEVTTGDSIEAFLRLYSTLLFMLPLR